MAIDQLEELSPFHSISASETSGAGTVIMSVNPAGTQPRGPQAVRVQYQGVQLATLTGTLAWQIRYSYDRGATWVAGPSGPSLTLTTTPQLGEQMISIQPPAPPSGFDCGLVSVQILGVFSGSATGTAATYRADLLH